ncbi:MAG: type II toxin-antitoxin system RelE/ParE family toxin [Spirochaetaceae bacterium]|jgi:toxin ParE1/3/4|nr:type II toxin-antitoxin system RelE/ParE family toxin [Spirochaetaceae bacterium]
MKILWTALSIQDLENIHEYISKDSIYYADRQIERILNCEHDIADYPKSGRAVPEYSDDLIREIIIDNYRVIYRIESEHINILTVFHGAQLL